MTFISDVSRSILPQLDNLVGVGVGTAVGSLT